jgi:hypothetical protein
MRYQRAGDSYLVRFETGEELVGALTAFAADQRIDTATFVGIGSVSDAVLGYFDREAGDYARHEVSGDMEIVSLTGNITLKDGRPFPHAHVALGGRDFRAVAGHLFEGKVAATCEVVVRPLPGAVQRQKDAKTGLYLLDL